MEVQKVKIFCKSEFKKEAEMSTKLPHSLPDEKPEDLQKRLGCMNGIFQLFDRHHSFAGRRISSHNPKRLPPGTGQNVNCGKDLNGVTEKRLERNPKKVEKDKQILPVDLSRTSCSSTCSSTFSSVDCNKTTQAEPTASDQRIFPETTFAVVAMKKTCSSSHLERQSLDLRDVVVESMSRDIRGLSVKTTNIEERGGHAMKHIDSPKPLKSGEPGALPFPTREAPRFSYDERESRDTLKSTIKLKELPPRLSLDSRVCSIRSFASESRSNYPSREKESENGISRQIIYEDQEPGSNKRPSSIVARLMGLEPIPDCMPTKDAQRVKTGICLYEDSRLSKLGDETKKNQVSGSPRVSCKDTASPRLRNDNLVMKSTSSSRLPLEPALWKQAEGSRNSKKQAFKYEEASTKSPRAPPSVYGEIEKRLTELEFNKSGKDLRALKQILEAMQMTSERSENKNEGQPSESQTSNCTQHISLDQSSTQQSQQNNQPGSPIIKGNVPRRSESQIVIIKPDKVMEKPATPNYGKSGLQKIWTGGSTPIIQDLVGRQTVKDLAPGNNHLTGASSWPKPYMNNKTNARTLRSSRYPRAPQHMSQETPATFRRCSGNVSPRMQQEKHGMDKQSRPTTQTSELRRARRQSSKQPIESGSPCRKSKPKSINIQEGDDKSSRLSSETRNLSHQGDNVSMQSESSIRIASENDAEVTSTMYRSDNYRDEDFATRNGGKSTAELSVATFEQPSPVSVLDTMLCEEDSPSPVKKISTAFQDDATLNSDKAELDEEYIDHLQNSRKPSPSSNFVRHYLVQKLRLVNSTSNEATKDHIASPFDNTTPDQRHIAEILLAAGLAKDLISSPPIIQHNQLGQLINPYLFNVIEETKGNTKLADEHHKKSSHSKSNMRFERKLIFDAVNEIIARESALAGSAEFRIFQNKIGGRSKSEEKHLRELWSQMDHQQTTSNCRLNMEDDRLISISSDLSHQLDKWEYYRPELPGLVLDMERLIFKDLISDVVSGEAAGPQMQPGKHRKPLFLK